MFEERQTNRLVGLRFGLPEASVQNHKRKHVPAAIHEAYTDALSEHDEAIIAKERASALVRLPHERSIPVDPLKEIEGLLSIVQQYRQKQATALAAARASVKETFSKERAADLLVQSVLRDRADLRALVAKSESGAATA